MNRLIDVILLLLFSYLGWMGVYEFVTVGSGVWNIFEWSEAERFCILVLWVVVLALYYAKIKDIL